MNTITGTLPPSRDTVGVIGDIYEDSSTAKKYRLVCVYQDSLHQGIVYIWHQIRDYNEGAQPSVPDGNEVYY